MVSNNDFLKKTEIFKAATLLGNSCCKSKMGKFSIPINKNIDCGIENYTIIKISVLWHFEHFV